MVGTQMFVVLYSKLFRVFDLLLNLLKEKI